MKRLLVLLALLVLLIPGAKAASSDAAPGSDASDSGVSAPQSISDIVEKQMQGSGANDLYSKAPQQAQNSLGKLGLKSPDPNGFSKLTPKGLFSLVLSNLSDAAKAPMRSMALVLGVLLAYALLNTLKTSLAEKPLKGVFDTVCSLCIAGSVIVPVAACIRTCDNTITQAGNFSISFLPVFAGLSAASGHPTSAAVLQAIMLMLSNGIIALASTTFVPLVSIYLAFCVIGSVAPGIKISGVASFAKNVAVWGMGLSVTIFVAVLAIQGMIANAADTVAVKAAKFVVGSFVPVVGSALSDALNTIVGCANLLKTATGAYAIVVFIVIFLPPVLECLLWMLAMDVSAAAAEILSVDSMKGLLKSVREALGVILALVISTELALIVSVSVMLLLGMGS
ncbi:MAG: hypothetical protein P4M02_10850 [Clostridia bacterium]|nr:hypothetical protein [Clostridia bacterium]